MLFFTSEFIVLFGVVLLLYYTLPHKWRWGLLLAASYYFYGYHHPGYVLLLLSSTLVDYVVGIKINNDQGVRRRYWLLLSICVNLGLLFFFKYFNFFGAQIEIVARWFGMEVGMPRHSLILPIGLSFYTFQTIGYIVDVYRGYLTPERHLGKFALYVCFFPQLLAGPIEKAKNLIPQFHFKYRFDYEIFVSGARLILWGLFKKLVIADRVARYVNEVFQVGSDYEGSIVILAAFLFWIQLLYDFGAYCDIAIGTARMLGVRLSRNFYNHIYLQSFTHYWREWHITLTNWFRNYVFFVIVQLRKSRVFWYLSLLITFALTGLWHGANWTYILWGALNGVLLIGEYRTAKLRTTLSATLQIDKFPRLKYGIELFYFLSLGVILSVVFRAESIEHVGDLLGRMKEWQGLHWKIGIAGHDQIMMFSFLAISEVFNLIMGKRPFDEFCSNIARPIRWLIYLVLVYALLLLQVGTNQFVYFEF